MRNIFTLVLLFISTYLTAQDGIPAMWGPTSNGQVTAYAGNDVFTQTARQEIVVLPDNSILQSFTVINGTNWDFGVAKFDQDGNLVPSFGGNNTGYVYIDFGGTNDQANALAVQSDGKIVVSGTSFSPTNDGSFAVARLNPNGTLDAGFGTGGKFTTNLGVNDESYALLIQPDQKIVLGGSTGNSSAIFSFGLIRLTTSGALDAGFGTGGKVITTISGADQIQGLAYDNSTNKIIAAGFTAFGNIADFALTRYLPNGSLDSAPGSFGNNGIVITDFGLNQDDAAYSVAVNSVGKIIAGGFTNSSSTSTVNRNFALAQYTSNGTPDPIFGTSGKVITDFGANETGYDLLIQPDNKILLMGTTNTGTFPGTNGNFAIARYLPSGSPDPNFGPGNIGRTTIDFGGNDLGYSVALGSGYILAGGVTDVNSTQLALAKLINIGSSLPANLLTFTAHKQSGSVLLQWQTASEKDLYGFDVLKSTDGNHFEKIGEVRAAGNAVSIKNYSLTDGQPLLPVTFYRLRMINIDRSFTYSPVVVVKSNSSFVVFPNPVKTQLNLQFTEPPGVVKITITDVTGKVIRTMQMRSTGSTLSASVSMDLLPGGIYFLGINSKTIKIVKE